MNLPPGSAVAVGGDDASRGTGLEAGRATSPLHPQHAAEASAAFTELYRHHYAAVGGYLWRRTGDAHLTEDLLAETFLAALRGFDRLRAREADARFWLLRVATNLLRKRWRSDTRGRTAEYAPELGASSPDASLALAHEEEMGRARRALRALDPDQQGVLSLYYVEGLALAEIALVLECRPGTVKSRLARARTALAAELARKG